jgi:hypothetical protein
MSPVSIPLSTVSTGIVFNLLKFIENSVPSLRGQCFAYLRPNTNHPYTRNCHKLLASISEKFCVPYARAKVCIAVAHALQRTSCLAFLSYGRLAHDREGKLLEAVVTATPSRLVHSLWVSHQSQSRSIHSNPLTSTSPSECSLPFSNSFFNEPHACNSNPSIAAAMGALNTKAPNFLAKFAISSYG